MTKSEVKATATEGIGARKAAELVKLSNEFKSDMIIRLENKSVNAKSLIGVIFLGIKNGDKLSVSAEGADEKAAAAALVKFLGGTD
jgi:phosphotransferase system HPr (HPr) family protein